ncbi:hypothetical protein [Labedella endophytica]|uniref:Uncharacterized protein n=1 Tax=Labedella endophytica TaxID=1523160 RepID=A0A3S0V8T8_9MICO|nr:hypothetical protein [Labedella endophytica]RUQ98215.1 hypothetical protein ELQ94_14450 [Labedella endophytica]
MKSMWRAVSATVVVASLGVLGLSACASAEKSAEPTALDDLASQLDTLESRMDRIMWSRPAPSSLWFQLDPANEVGAVVLASDTAGGVTTAPFPYAHEVGDDLLTVDVFVSALTRAGGPVSADAANAYVCASYAIDSTSQVFTRSAVECPADLVPVGGAAVTLDDLELDPVA